MRLSISILLLVLTVSLSGQQSCFENIGDFSFHGNDVKTHYANAAIIFAGSDLDVSIFPGDSSNSSYVGDARDARRVLLERPFGGPYWRTV